MFTFGPIPSRRLGSSLGVNHLPGKYCSYACVYCQAGRTTHLSKDRREFFRTADVIASLEAHLADLSARQVRVDYISFVPDGEPTLDIHLGELLAQSRRFGYPIAVFTNSTLLPDPVVRQELCIADYVSVKVDSVQPDIWWQVDRPHGHLILDQILEGIRLFAREYKGRLVTETMLVQGISDSLPALVKTAEFIAGINPFTCYLAVPTRPPVESWVLPPDQVILAQAQAVFRSRISSPVELLCQGDPSEFASTSQAVQNILAITAVHPMRRSAVLKMLVAAGESESTLDKLLERGLLIPIDYLGDRFYRRSPLLDIDRFPIRG